MPRGENKYSKINCRERIDDYIKNDERIEGMKQLCTYMYYDYFKKRKNDFNIGDRDPFIEDLHSNLSRALEGKKGLSVHYVLAMEQFFRKSLYDIIHGVGDIDETIDPLTIKYAVYKNSYSLCEKLAERIGNRWISRRCDEFDKTVLDYIVDRNSAGKPINEVVRYLIDHGEIVFHGSDLERYDNGKAEGIFSIIMELDDPEVFAKFAPNGCIFYSRDEKSEYRKFCYDTILASKEVYKSIITPTKGKVSEDVIVPTMNQSFEYLLDYCIENDRAKECNEMISAYEEFVNGIIDDERAKRSNNVKLYSTVASHNHRRSVLEIESDNGCTSICELLDLDKIERISDEDLNGRLSALTPLEILKKINYKSLKELEDGDYYIDHEKEKIYYKMKEPTADITLFLEMTKRGYTCIPHCEIAGDELYALEWQRDSAALKGKQIKRNYNFIFKSLGEIHKVMLDMSTDGRVHSFHYFWMFNREPQSQSYDPSPYLNMNFRYASLKSPTESLVDMIIRVFYDTESTDSFLKEYDSYLSIASGVNESLKAYALPEVLESLGDKMLSVIDERLAKHVNDKEGDFNFYRFNQLTHLRSVVLLIKDELNALASAEGVK